MKAEERTSSPPKKHEKPDPKAEKQHTNAAPHTNSLLRKHEKQEGKADNPEAEVETSNFSTAKNASRDAFLRCAKLISFTIPYELNR
jgi:hypothetical protein